MSKEAIKLAIEWIEKQPEEITASKYDVDTRYAVLKELEAALTQEQDEPIAEVTSETGAEITMSWWHEPALPIGTKLYTTPQPKHEQGYKDGYEAGWTKALNEAYSNREQEPVAWVNKERNTITWDKLYPDMDALYATPQRTSLTDEQIKKSSLEAGMQEHYMDFHSGFIRFARAIEAAHGIKE